MYHPSHKDQIVALRRIEGQIRGIQKMVEEINFDPSECFMNEFMGFHHIKSQDHSCLINVFEFMRSEFMVTSTNF